MCTHIDRRTYMHIYNWWMEQKTNSHTLFLLSGLLITSQAKFLQKITSQINLYIKGELQKAIDSKFKAVFHSNILIISQATVFIWPCLIIVHTCVFILGPKCFSLNTKLPHVYFSFQCDYESSLYFLLCSLYLLFYEEGAHSILDSNFITSFQQNS